MMALYEFGKFEPVFLKKLMSLCLIAHQSKLKPLET